MLIGLIDFHGLSHILEGDHPQQVEVCDDCGIIFQQKEDIQYLSTLPYVNLHLNYEENLNVILIKFSPIFIAALYPSDYFNKPPPIKLV